MWVYYQAQPVPWWGWIVIALVFWVIPAGFIYWLGRKL